MNIKHILFLLAALFVVGCDHGAAISDTDADITPDGMVVDVDSGVDAGVDSDVPDSGTDALVDSGVDSDVPDSGVDANVVVTVCGNGVLEVGEGCDDGNLVTEVCGYDSPCTVCNGSCQSVAGVVPTCGDGNVDPVEDCDDGNMVDTDGCTYACTITQWVCIDHKMVGNFSNPAGTPAVCDNASGEFYFDGTSGTDPSVVVAQSIVVTINGSPTTTGYSVANNEMRKIQYPSMIDSWGFRARPCYHYGAMPHTECGYLAP